MYIDSKHFPGVYLKNNPSVLFFSLTYSDRCFIPSRSQPMSTDVNLMHIYPVERIIVK